MKLIGQGVPFVSKAVRHRAKITEKSMVHSFAAQSPEVWSGLGKNGIV
jgi:hypothetical protein